MFRSDDFLTISCQIQVRKHIPAEPRHPAAYDKGVRNAGNIADPASGAFGGPPVAKPDGGSAALEQVPCVRHSRLLEIGLPAQDAAHPAAEVAQLGQTQQRIAIAQASSSPPRLCAGWNLHSHPLSQIQRSRTKVDSNPIAIHYLGKLFILKFQ